MDANLQQLLKATKVSRTVYAFVSPETTVVLDKVLDETREQLHEMYMEPWTQKQDIVHQEFFETWRNWAKPVIGNIDFDTWYHQYPTAGSSEGIKEAIYAKAGKCIHVFSGDYEGYSSYANAAGVGLQIHRREDWEFVPKEMTTGDVFILSQPSAIDGNVWKAYDAFLSKMETCGCEVYLDLTYVGCVAKKFAVKTDYNCIKAIFFSLSKPMGVYYHRIGGMLSKREFPGLFGNKWFKNLLSLRYGTELMRELPVHRLATDYSTSQLNAIRLAKASTGLELIPSDVYLLATTRNRATNPILAEYLWRGHSQSGSARACLTALIASLVYGTSAEVVPRQHEII